MENKLEEVNPDEIQTTSQPAPETEIGTALTPTIDEKDTSRKPHVNKSLPAKAATKSTHKPEEPISNPLLLDPYEWDKCTITVGYSLLPDKNVTVSVHNHKDEPIVREFPVEEVPLPEKISSVMVTLQSIWPTNSVNATVVLLPKPENVPERPIIASVRVATDTPIVQEGVESNLPFPAPIVAMLEELKAMVPERALKNIEKNTKAKTATTVKPANKSTTSKPVTPVNVPATNKNINQNQMKLF